LDITLTGIKLNDITYALRVFQAILLQSKETAETMKDSDDEEEDDDIALEIDEDMDLDDLDLDGDDDGDDIGSLPDDDLDIQLDDIDLDAELDTGEDKDAATSSKGKSTVIKTAFT